MKSLDFLGYDWVRLFRDWAVQGREGATLFGVAPSDVGLSRWCLGVGQTWRESRDGLILCRKTETVIRLLYFYIL